MIRRLSFLLVAALAPLPALAQFECQTGDLITVRLLPRPFGGVDYCIPDTIDPPLLCGIEPFFVRWRIESTCDGTYTVKILGDSTKANITGALICEPEKEYQGHVSGDENLVCQTLPFGKWGYRIAVCRPDGHCASTDPGIWVNRPGVTPEYVPTQADYGKAKAEAKNIRYTTEADLKKIPKGAPAKTPVQKPKSPRP
jgi:hypothetical protein